MSGIGKRVGLLAMVASLGLAACDQLPFAEADELPLGKVKLPAGFAIELVSGDVPNARQIALGPEGALFAGTRREGKVYALPGVGDDWEADDVVVIAQDLTRPSGVTIHNGYLYVAAVDLLFRYPDIEARLGNLPEPEILADDLPEETHHGWRHIKFGPDDRLYMPIGMPCNSCIVDPPYAEILSMNADGTDRQTVARGIRSVQSLEWHPDTDELWFADIGRDHLGDEFPPEEINRVSEPNPHFGAPYCHAGTIVDYDLEEERPCEDFVPPAATLPAHVSPLGIVFYDGEMFPEEYRGKLFVAEHGSWNRSTRIGYRISIVEFDENFEFVSYDIFAEGWLNPDESRWGRPVDLLVAPDGSLLVSDDYAGAIYRISYTAQ